MAKQITHSATLKAEGFGDEEERDAYLEKNIFFVLKDARWEKLVRKNLAAIGKGIG